MKGTSILLMLAIGGVFSPSIAQCSFPPDIRLVFEGWSADSKQFVLRKTVVDTGDNSITEDVLYVIEVSRSKIDVEKKQDYNERTVEALSPVKVEPIKSDNRGTKTFIVGPSEYVYVDYSTVIDDVENGTPSYTIHRRIWTLDDGMTRMMFKEDESFSGVSMMSETPMDGYLSPDGSSLLVLFDVTSHFNRKGFIVIDLSQSRIIEKKIRVLE